MIWANLNELDLNSKLAIVYFIKDPSINNKKALKLSEGSLMYLM